MACRMDMATSRRLAASLWRARQPRAWRARQRLAAKRASLQGLAVLDNGEALVLGELVAEGVAAVAAAGPRRVVDLPALEGRQLRVGAAREHRHLPAELLRVVVLLAGAVGAGEDP